MSREDNELQREVYNFFMNIKHIPTRYAKFRGFCLSVFHDVTIVSDREFNIQGKLKSWRPSDSAFNFSITPKNLTSHMIDSVLDVISSEQEYFQKMKEVWEGNINSIMRQLE